MVDFIYLNGEFVAPEAARVSVYDRGFLFGDAVFETLRAYHGKPFAPAEHFARLLASATAVGIVLPFDETAFCAILNDTLTRNRLTDAMLRCTVSRGEGPPLPAPEGHGPPTVVVMPRAVPASAGWSAGIAAVVAPMQAASALDPAIKSTSFLPHVVALGHARSHGAAEAILLNRQGEVAEGAISNLFGVWDGVLITPPQSAGLLPGITRKVVLGLADEIGMPYQEAAIPRERLSFASELLVTNSGWEIMPITRLDGVPVGDGTAGPVAKRLYAGYREAVLRSF